MIKFYDFILTIITPFIRAWGKLHFPFTHKKVTGAHYYLWRDQINIGTVLLTKTRGELSNWINPTDLKHGAIYVGDVNGTGVRYVAEALGAGVVLTDLVTFLTTKDIVVGYSPKFIRDEEIFNSCIQEASLRFQGVPYDYLFNKDGKAFYCFELVANCLVSAYPELQLKCKEILKGKRIYDEKTFMDESLFKKEFDSRVM